MTVETVGGVLAAALGRAGNRVALRAHGQLRTHAELLANATRLANALAGKGVRPGDRVALMVGDR
ncbi:MAG TPA: AMP-binding protein, partial [Mycobacteriales bacterium]|nr:AMP-binding protein [Mycobacteriales bacterium]